MRVLILANDYKTIANFRIELLTAMVDEGFEVHLSLPKDERNELFVKMGCQLHENALTRHGTNPLKEISLMKDYKTIISSIKPDLVLTYTVKPNIYGSLACASLKIPVMNTVTGVGSTMQGQGIVQKFMLSFQRYAMRKSKVVFFQNQANMNLFNLKLKNDGKITLLPGSGVNLKNHPCIPYPDEKGKIKFIIVSRLREDKGFDELFEAIEKLGTRDDVEFNIVGWYEEDKYKEIVSKFSEEYNVVYHGEKTQQEVQALIAQCHCLIHPSYHEGMANVLMEASATGRPCLASDIPGCQEIVDDGVTGYTFAVKDSGSLKGSIEKFLALHYGSRKEMGNKARLKMEKEFDRDIVIGLYMQEICKYK
ncbi:MAG: glycosyltransferase family 4 protein [Clostridiaceae bacterium]|nr:glycosyltransferase family 4 protein [Clostridiaceae bacterium]